MTVGSVLARGVGKSPRGLLRRMGVVRSTALAAVACGSASTTGSPSASPQGSDLFNPANFSTSTVSWLANNQNATGQPVMGGTLKVEGSTDLSAAADPQA